MRWKVRTVGLLRVKKNQIDPGGVDNAEKVVKALLNLRRTVGDITLASSIEVCEGLKFSPADISQEIISICHA